MMTVPVTNLKVQRPAHHQDQGLYQAIALLFEEDRLTGVVVLDRSAQPGVWRDVAGLRFAWGTTFSGAS